MVTHNHFDNLGKLVITSNLLSFLIIPIILFINDKYFSPNDYYEKKNQLNE